MRIYAHRGVSAHLPENTLAAFSHAIELGVEGIELDVHLSADNIPVVIHDDTVDRTTNGTGAIGEFTARELGLLDAGGGQFVPTLAAVLALAAGKVRVNIELKDAAASMPVLKVVADFSVLDWFGSSSDWNALAEMTRLAPTSDCYPTTMGLAVNPDGEGALGDAIDFAISHNSTGVSVWEGALNRSAVETLHARGLEVWAWTVNDPARAQELADLGVDALCADDPALIRDSLLAERASLPLVQ